MNKIINRKIFFIALLLIVVSVFSACVEINVDTNDDKVDESGEVDDVSEISDCEFDRDLDLIKPQEYDIFGGEEFQTAVCGYFKTRDEMVFEQPQTTALFVITDYTDLKFKESISKGIDRGNTVNSSINGYNALGLGCFEDGRILGNIYDNELSLGNYISSEVEDAILASSEEKPVKLILTFGIHEGFGCSCCNLVHEVELYENF